MPLVSSSIPNLINGVSQQPAALRLASQAEQVINCMPSPVEGLKKRPASEHVAKLFSGSVANDPPYCHIVDRDGSIQHLLVIRDGSVKVFALDGTERTVSTPNGTAYLNVTGNPSEQFRLASIADTTFIVNREKTVAMDTSNLSTNWGTKGMIFVKAANYSTTYSVTVAGVTKTYATGATGALSTITIATNLRNSLAGDSNLSGFTFTQNDFVIRVTKNDGSDYTMSASDTRSSTDISSIKGTVSAINDLPASAEHGFKVRVQGSAATSFDDYYVEFEANAGSGFGPGVWRETVASNIQYQFDRSTMPHVLVRAANNTFTFKQFEWSGRIAGDLTSAPNPTFVGSQIKNINVFRNRLVFLADENVVMSAADNYDRFFPETVQTVVDSDPIDLTSGGTSINFLTSSLAFANTLLLFSAHGQFRLDTGATTVGTALTPKTATVTAITTFDQVQTVDPVGVGRTVYLAIPKGADNSGLREFFLPDASGPVPLSEEVSTPVPRFVPSNLISLTASVSEEALAMVSSDEYQRLYLYKFFFQDDNKLQSAWGYWEINAGGKIVGTAMLDSDLYQVIEYSDGVYLQKTSLRPENVDATAEFEVLLDRKTTEASCTVAVNNAGGLGVTSTITLPYPIANANKTVLVGRKATSNTIAHGLVLEPTAESLTGGSGGNGTITVRGDLSNAKFFVGETYEMLYEFSTPYVKEEPPGGGVSVAAGPRLQLRTWTVVFDDTSTFELRITPQGRDVNKFPYNGITTGSGNPVLGSASLSTASFRAPVMARNIDTKIEIFSDSPMPCRMQSAEWEGWLQNRAPRI